MSYLKKRKNAFKFAGKGFWTLLSREPHAKIHLSFALIAILAGIILNISAIEWCLVVLCIGGVFAAEAFNTALEKLSDRVSMEQHPLIGAAKDIAAGGVLIMAVVAAIVGFIVFLPKIISCLGVE